MQKQGEAADISLTFLSTEKISLSPWRLLSFCCLKSSCCCACWHFEKSKANTLQNNPPKYSLNVCSSVLGKQRKGEGQKRGGEWKAWGCHMPFTEQMYLPLAKYSEFTITSLELNRMPLANQQGVLPGKPHRLITEVPKCIAETFSR